MSNSKTQFPIGICLISAGKLRVFSLIVFVAKCFCNKLWIGWHSVALNRGAFFKPKKQKSANWNNCTKKWREITHLNLKSKERHWKSWTKMGYFKIHKWLFFLQFCCETCRLLKRFKKNARFLNYFLKVKQVGENQRWKLDWQCFYEGWVGNCWNVF